MKNNNCPTPGQIKKLHALRRALGLDEPTYRAILERFGAASSKNLSPRALARCIEQLEQDAVEAGVWQGRGGAPVSRKRPGSASDAQLRLVAALWKQVSRQETETGRKAALDKLVMRIAGKPKLAWCGQRDIEKLVSALEAMGAKRE